MLQVEYIGVKNISGRDLILTQDGNHLPFAKDEVKILENSAGLHALSRSVVGLDKESGHTVPKALYAQVALADALKVAKEPENKSLVAARKQKEKDDKRRDEIRAEVLATMKAEGWVKKEKN